METKLSFNILVTFVGLLVIFVQIVFLGTGTLIQQ